MRYRNYILWMLALWTMVGMGTACGCKKRQQALFTPGSIKFPVVRMGEAPPLHHQ